MRYRQSITLAGETIGRVDGDSATGTFEHFLTSPQGHHVLALDACGGTQRVVSYGAFAEVLQELTASTNLSGDKYGQEFNGKTFDEVSGLHDYGARSFDPLALTWSSPDPLYTGAPDISATEPTRGNLYTFTANNPVNMVDPNGFDSTCVFGDCAASADFPEGAGETIVMQGTAPQAPAGPADWEWDLPTGGHAYERLLADGAAAEARGVREFVPPLPARRTPSPAGSLSGPLIPTRSPNGWSRTKPTSPASSALWSTPSTRRRKTPGWATPVLAAGSPWVGLATDRTRSGAASPVGDGHRSSTAGSRGLAAGHRNTVRAGNAARPGCAG